MGASSSPSSRSERGRSPLQGAKVLARSLEVNLTAHCNLACYGCDHASPLHAEAYLSVEELARDLAALAPVYHVFEFLLTGGEPLLHPKLLEIVDTIRASGVAEKITMITNGVLLHTAPAALWSRLDKIGVSIYPGVKRKLSESEIRAQAARHGLLLWYKPTDDFTMKLLHAENRDRDLVGRIYSTCTLRNSCHTIHNGRYYKCSPSPFVPDWLERVGVGAVDLSGDSIPVRDNPDLRDQLESYLRSAEPLGACRYCLGCVGKSIPSRQMNKLAIQRWSSEKDPEIREAVDWPALTRAEAQLRGVTLTGMLRTTFGERLRWVASRWSGQLLGISLIGLRIRLLLKRLARRALFAREPSGQG